MRYVIAALTACAAALAGCAVDRTTVSASEPHGIIDVGGSQIAKDIHAVVLQEIDGRPVAASGFDEVPPNASAVIVDRDFIQTGQTAFYVSPGPHTFRVTAIIRDDLALTLPPARSTSDRDVGLLELNVAEGRRYLIGARLDSARPEHWEPVVYAVEPIPGYESGFEDR